MKYLVSQFINEDKVRNLITFKPNPLAEGKYTKLGLLSPVFHGDMEFLAAFKKEQKPAFSRCGPPYLSLLSFSPHRQGSFANPPLCAAPN